LASIFFGGIFSRKNSRRKKFSQKSACYGVKIQNSIPIFTSIFLARIFVRDFFGENFFGENFFGENFFGENFFGENFFGENFFDGYFLVEFFAKKILAKIGWLVSLRTTYKAHSSLIKDFS
jgi:hypothetical protein